MLRLCITGGVWQEFWWMASAIWRSVFITKHEPQEEMQSDVSLWYVKILALAFIHCSLHLLALVLVMRSFAIYVVVGWFRSEFGVVWKMINLGWQRTTPPQDGAIQNIWCCHKSKELESGASCPKTLPVSMLNSVSSDAFLLSLWIWI